MGAVAGSGSELGARYSVTPQLASVASRSAFENASNAASCPARAK
jgi:hypothetical protein